MKEIDLPSRAVLKILHIPFGTAKDLHSAFLQECKGVELDVNAIKNVFCLAFSSPRLEACIWKCLENCLSNHSGHDLKITKETFESEEAREDFVTVFIEVGRHVLMPFLNPLIARSQALLEEMTKSFPPRK